MTLALAGSRSVLELGGIGSLGHGESFEQCLIETTPAASCYQNLASQTQYNASNSFLIFCLETDTLFFQINNSEYVLHFVTQE